jgi:hypothetical protein
MRPRHRHIDFAGNRFAVAIAGPEFGGRLRFEGPDGQVPCIPRELVAQLDYPARGTCGRIEDVTGFEEEALRSFHSEGERDKSAGKKDRKRYNIGYRRRLGGGGKEEGEKRTTHDLFVVDHWDAFIPRGFFVRQF